MKPENKRKNVTKNKKSLKNKGNNTLLIAGLAGVILLAGIAYGLINKNEEIAETEISLPSYAYTNPLTLKAYRYATEHPDVLEQIPCYCGCGGHADHRFLRDCYIHDDWTYDEHASFCDICVAEAIKTQEYLEKGMTMKEVRARIDAEYSKYIDGKTNTPPVSDYYKPILTAQAAELSIPEPQKTTTQVVDLSKYSFQESFDSLADGLNLTSSGVNRAYFINNKLLIGTELESKYVFSMSRDETFYGRKIIGMFSADFSPGSWIELHDLGYENTKDTTLRGNIEQGMKNIVFTRPLIYGHDQNVVNVMKLMGNLNSIPTSYQTYRPLLDVLDYQNAGVAMVLKEQMSFSDINYWSVTPVNGKVELVKAYNITDTEKIPASLDIYKPQMNGNVLVIKITSDLATIQTEKDNIDNAVKI